MRRVEKNKIKSKIINYSDFLSSSKDISKSKILAKLINSIHNKFAPPFLVVTGHSNVLSVLETKIGCSFTDSDRWLYKVDINSQVAGFFL